MRKPFVSKPKTWAPMKRKPEGAKPRARGKNINRPEQKVQIDCVRFLRLALVPPAKVWFVPNGGHLTRAQHGLFHEMGLLSGVYDLHFIWPGSGYGVIEMKSDDGALRASQIIFGDDIVKCGHRQATCRSLDEVVETCRRWGVPLRASVSA